MSKLMKVSNLKENSLVMLKPDVVDQNLVFPIVVSLISKGLKIENIQVVELNKTQAIEFYNNATISREEKLSAKTLLTPEEIYLEKAKIAEIEDRNSNFISSGKMVALSVAPQIENGNNEKFICDVRLIVEDMRKNFSSNHEKFTFACNGIHAADSYEALIRDVNFLEKYKLENRDLSEVYPKSDLPNRDRLPENDYNLLLSREFSEAISGEEFTSFCNSNDCGRALKAMLNEFNKFLVNYSLSPTVSNSIILKNSIEFVKGGVNANNYELKNSDQVSKFNVTKSILDNIFKDDKLKNIVKSIERIDSKISNSIDITIGNKKEFYHQHIANKEFKQNEIEI